MRPFDLSRLGGWGDLPFFKNDLPDIEVALEAETRPVYPPADKVFAALERTQPEDVRVVILGQDPYPQSGKANGLAFSITNDFPPRRHRDSLDNIFQELNDDLAIQRQASNLENRAGQGVFLFNCLALTVPDSKAGGHRSLGWKRLTSEVLARLSDHPRAYLLWGGDAQRAARGVDADTNFILKSSHPSPMGVHKTGTGYEAFRNSRPFSRTNVWLQNNDFRPINWGDPEDQ